MQEDRERAVFSCSTSNSTIQLLTALKPVVVNLHIHTNHMLFTIIYTRRDWGQLLFKTNESTCKVGQINPIPENMVHHHLSAVEVESLMSRAA